MADSKTNFSPPTSIGLLGGTFDPLHHGHLNLAIELQEKCHLEEIWFIPNAHSPLKEAAFTPAFHRLKMVELALQPFSNFKTLDIELTKPGPSYTIDTVNLLQNRYPEKQFFLLLGEDSALQLGRWKSLEELLEKIDVRIGSRCGGIFKKNLANTGVSPVVQEQLIENFIDIPQMDISATTIRKRLKQRLYCYHLLPSIVLDYIYENQLYFND